MGNRKDRHRVLFKSRKIRAFSMFLALSLALGSVPVVQIKAESLADKAVGDSELSSILSEIRSCFVNGEMLNTSVFRELYNAAERDYAALSQTERAELPSIEGTGIVSYVGSYGELRQLMQNAAETIEDIKIAETLGARITETNYTNFANAMLDVSNSNVDASNGASMGTLDIFYDKYNYLLDSDKNRYYEYFQYLLSSDDSVRDYLIDSSTYIVSGSDTAGWLLVSNSTGKKYLTVYKDLLKVYNIEKAYLKLRSDIGSDSELKSYGITDDQMADIAKFNSLVTTNGGATTIAKLNYYNGSEITAFLQKYQHIKTFKDSLASITKKPETESEMRVAIQTYTLYNNLTSDEKDMITDDDLTKLNYYCLEQTGIKTLIDQIDAIVWPTNDSTYATFTSAYNSAMNAYNALIAQYNSSSGVGALVTNRDYLLGDMTSIKDIIDRIKTVEKTEDQKMCGLYTVTMTMINSDYSALSTTNKTRVYNWATFNTIYTDTKAAYDLRARIDRLEIGLTADDETEVDSIRAAYTALNAKAKAYFGSTYVNKISALEYNLYALKANDANYVIGLIDKIGDVSSYNNLALAGKRIVAAETAYAGLASTVKSLVTNYSALTAARATYNSLRADLSKATVTNIKKGYVFTGSTIKPAPVVTVNGVILVKNEDYTVTYSSNKNVGTGYVTIKAIDGSGYKGSFKKSFIIVKDSIKSGKVTGLSSSYKYTGKAIKPTFKLKVNGHYVTKGTGYTVTYKNNKKKGTATITIKGKGNYKGTITKKFKIK